MLALCKVDALWIGLRDVFAHHTTLNQTSHAARVVIDEEGCIAAAFTVLAPGGEAPPEEEVDFVLDRPFLFCVTGNGGLPLFVGVVNDPMKAS